MKQQIQSNKGQARKSNQQQNSGRGKTNVPGQNPRQNDDPSHDEHHDESRQP